MSERPASGEPQRPGDGDPPPDDAWVAPSSSPGAEPSPDPQAPPETPPAAPAAEGSADAGPLLPPPPADPNAVAIERAGLNEQSAAWLHEVARQVDPRLDRVAPEWRRGPQADAARACAFGLLLGYLARTYPHARNDLSRTAEAHPSYSSLPAGNRLGLLQEISADSPRMAAWLGPLVEVTDPQRLRALLD